MDILEILNSCQTEEELQHFIDNRLSECIEEGLSLSDGITYIGDNLDINPNYSLYPNSSIYGGYDINVFWQQFIPPDIKIVFGVEYPFCHNGYYYYMNDFDYLLSFIEFIQDKVIKEDIDLIGYIHLFLRSYFVNSFSLQKRELCFELLCDDHGMHYPRINERSINAFKGNGMARCTEFGAVAQNLMSFFGLETIYIHDKEHAYNIVELSDNNRYVIDFSKGVFLYNDLDKNRTYLPFMADISESPDEILQKLVSSDYRFVFNNYRLFKLGNIITQQDLSIKRTYGTGGYLAKEKRIIH